MRHVTLRSETDFAGWRDWARALATQGVPPEEVRWRIDAGGHPPAAPPGASFSVSRALVALAGLVVQARDQGRFDLLYRLIWRAQAGELSLEDHSDPEVFRARALGFAVRAEAHRMRALLRYLPLGPRHVGWYRPAHFVLEANAQLLARRFPGFAVSILTPDGTTHWDGGGLRFGAGVAPEAITDDAALAAYWKGYGAEMLETARPGTSVPEAEPLAEDPWPPDRPPVGPVVLQADADPGVQEASAEAIGCKRCDLYRRATQTVFGEGPAGARVMFVGEQPGDQEDVIGRPFVGPAGQLLDRAMLEAGLDRRAVYVTNAVKHFKFIPRGKRRMHATPDAAEIAACNFWLDVERVRLRPALIVALGASAARAVLGRAVTISRERGRPIALASGQRVFVTVHPSFLLRVPDEEAKRREYRAFVEDLRAIGRIMPS